MPDSSQTLCVPSFARLPDYCGLWLCEESHFRALWNIGERLDLAAHVAAGLANPPVIRSQLEMIPSSGGQSIALINVTGTLMKQQSSLGGTSTVQLRRDVRQAANDPNVSAILLAIESPGGTVSGTDDLAAEVRAARRRKPVWSHCDDLMASAGYWIGSQAEQIFANSNTALVGSIGTYLAVYDESGAAEQQGIKTLLFATGALKGAGYPGTAVSEEQAAYFQGIVDGQQREFDKAVQRGRGLSDKELAQVRTGAVFQAPQALALKLIDGIRPLEKTIDALAASAKARRTQ